MHYSPTKDPNVEINLTSWDKRIQHMSAPDWCPNYQMGPPAKQPSWPKIFWRGVAAMIGRGQCPLHEGTNMHVAVGRTAWAVNAASHHFEAPILALSYLSMDWTVRAHLCSSMRSYWQFMCILAYWFQQQHAATYHDCFGFIRELSSVQSNDLLPNIPFCVE